ncbi:MULTISPECIES: dTDP-4-dehydrorhamnose 3,5-epimerase [unclassified Mucilaginibacter]|uniref:dTDP-4-dehydrorhamnose 3,5-epimerase n=1 Tax=unclassified Mucilaginibacter TaxID=2617802 RepID=UPI002AC8E15C|nr:MULTISPECIES: dTDP-4-dehydrorhamnose 3,5-epimerase [unclassified Mucilaginibacter]MEB0262600.1 dTDP-4-dehydrorhamnose 3,5-epimerase [Mucilaginibacter sp. 10I4]MEB0279219.1 dTDP-4-dehydrorhamnose 3,5-epimerase [Mucilaginibacter sp. 10B2]MEB0300681.1 dTDP-4-dehydrorhamnose 3,5-epimerase [Mucilaginibacter sp. 5C4]WPX23268.1 dTDP-4-dehydrorhamnose 3,5-epimerase [Mucilaginibacter sp. 5C4]
MGFTETIIPGVFLFEPKVFSDDRGYFYESYSKRAFTEAGIDADFVQDNQSLSQKNTIRGLHAQAPPYAQGKLVRVLQGAVLDVAVDAREGSPTYGRHVAVELSADNKLQLWVPPGCVHGFLTLQDNTLFVYKVSGGLYNKESEIGLAWNDPELAIGWGIAEKDALLSAKDQEQPAFATFDSPFTY